MENVLKEGERLDVLKRENIHIIQSSAVFSFSLDAVLLADFADLPRVKPAKIVDLCAGNGAVSFLLTGKTKNAIVGVELQEKLVDMARRTAQLNHLEEKVSFVHADVNEITQWIEPDSVDVITCNPPYFKISDSSFKNEKDAFAIARHEIYLTLDQLMKQTSHLLKMKGKAYFVHRPDRLMEIMETMRKNRIAPKKLQFIYPKHDKEANMILIEGIKDGKEDGFRVLPPLVVYNQKGEYSDKIKGILYGEQ